jgi:hypothetical protein
MLVLDQETKISLSIVHYLLNRTISKDVEPLGLLNFPFKNFPNVTYKHVLLNHRY